MIIITTEEDVNFCVNVGDSFQLQYTDRKGNTKVLIKEDIVKAMGITYVATFCFTDEKGNCVGSNISGFFGMREDLPKEILEARRLKDLNFEQVGNLIRTAGIQITYE